ncbi:MAG TPA: glycosyltransferase family 2 protein [Nevskiaceae bacterium]|nr:glycosyltransferase family 2 protein [Nevskiaceae bacterium]
MQHARELRPRVVRHAEIAKAERVLVCCARNEMPRFPSFLRHYRKLGIDHFIVIDNQSTDGLEEYLAAQPDASVWRAEGSYKRSNFGMDWCNHLLNRHCSGKWCVTVDPDELLVYPYCEDRDLRSLTAYMTSVGQQALFTVLVDAYGRGRLSETQLTPDGDPFTICPHFDRFNLTQRFDPRYQNFWIQGGVRMRRFFPSDPMKAPALNKVPLVKWRRGLYYISSMHHLNDPTLNCTVRTDHRAVSGVLLHFKYLSLLRHKAEEEMQRKEHYAGSVEYKAYLGAGDPVLYDAEVSLEYTGSRVFEEHGFMQAGGWF